MANEWKKRGIFCVETVWYGDRDQTSVRPMLELLGRAYTEVPFIYRNAVSKDEFKYHITSWLDLPAREYPILYLGYHGDAAANIFLVDDDKTHDFETRISFSDFGGFLQEQCKDRVVHFSSCGTLKVSTRCARNFLDITGARSVSGYDKVVDWMESIAFELLFLARMQKGGQLTLTSNVMNNCRNDVMNKSPYKEFRKHLGFNIWIS